MGVIPLSNCRQILFFRFPAGPEETQKGKTLFARRRILRTRATNQNFQFFFVLKFFINCANAGILLGRNLYPTNPKIKPSHHFCDFLLLLGFFKKYF